MRNPKATLEDLADATSRHANRTSPNDALMMRIVADAMEFMAMLRVGEAELTRLEIMLDKSECLRKGQAGYIGGQRDEIRSLKTALEAKDEEIEALRKIAKLAGNLTDRLAEVNEATSNARAFAAAMQYGKETAALAFALTEVGE